MAVVLSLVLLWLVIVYLPFLMPGWRALLGLCVALGLFHLGVRLGVAGWTAAEVPAPLVATGNFWLDLCVWALPVTILARAAGLAAKSWGVKGRWLGAVTLAGLLALPAFWAGQGAMTLWSRRPAPAACTARPIPILLSGIAGAVPWSEAIMLYLGPDIRREGRYPLLPRHGRAICRETSGGRDGLRITALSVRAAAFQRERCGAARLPDGEGSLCALLRDAGAEIVPEKMVFFEPGGIRPGDFGIPAAPTSAGTATGTGERLVVVPDTGLGEISATCRLAPAADGRLYCRMRRKIVEGLDLFWEIGALPEDLSVVLTGADALARETCATVFDVPGCRAAP
ncbi:hypothetical protein [Neotabrizicola shimadae]|uniref:Uncharacterized protein n=1 Tax=Neotabrizicola shimadae TaxID=2807096 RepID=A0A8G0ZYR4_9RHOB|nr:hypothetical protein [Neotabrizicola shimadae]QYZ71481.1 hypothetical protein JO391_08275 [Neotabrizicola shimadae]